MVLNEGIVQKQNYLKICIRDKFLSVKKCMCLCKCV